VGAPHVVRRLPAARHAAITSTDVRNPWRWLVAVTMTRSAGMLVLAIYLIVIGVAGLMHLAIPLAMTALLALLAGVLILVGR